MLDYADPESAAAMAQAGSVQERLLHSRGGKARGFAGVFEGLAGADAFLTPEITRGMIHDFNSHKGMSVSQIEAVRNVLNQNKVAGAVQTEILSAAINYSRAGAKDQGSAADALALAMGKAGGIMAGAGGPGKIATADDLVSRLVSGLGGLVTRIESMNGGGGEASPSVPVTYSAPAPTQTLVQ